MASQLLVRTTDGWTTEHPEAENVQIDGEELVYDRNSEELPPEESRDSASEAWVVYTDADRGRQRGGFRSTPMITPARRS